MPRDQTARGLAALAKRQSSDLIIKSPIQNYTPGSLNRWIRARSVVRSGTAGGVIAFAGTSLMLGAYAGGITPDYKKTRPSAPNVRVARALSASGIACSSQSFFGNGYAAAAVGNTIDFYDNRLSVSGGWLPNASIGQTAGGYPIKTATAGTISFTFDGAADTVVIYEVQTNVYASGTYSVNIDGTTVVSASQSTSLNTNTIRKVTLTGFTPVGAGAHTLNIVWASGHVGIIGAELFLSTSPTIRCINIAAGASTAAQWALPQYAGATYVVPSTIAPDLVIYECAANDWINAVPLANYRASLVTTMGAFSNSGNACDVLGVTPFPSANAYISRSIQQSYVDTFIDVCVQLGIPYIDLWRKVGTWESMNIVGRPILTQDNVHPNASGSWVYPDLITEALLFV